MSEDTEEFTRQLRAGQLQQLFDYLPGIYFVVKNRAGRVMMANELAVRLCGFEHEEEMIGKLDHDIFSLDRANTYVEDDRRVFETATSVVDRIELAPDPHNAINWFVTTKIPLYSHDSEVIGLACIARSMDDASEKLRPYMEMNEVLEHIRKHYAEPIKTDDLASMANLSSSQFERRFKKVFQISPSQHILNVRIRAACNILSATNDTIASIAIDCGFYDHSHLSRNFQKTVGISPSEFRAQGRKNP